jgi:hypothetical protein
VEHIFRVYGQAAQLSAVDLEGLGDGAGFAAVAEEGEVAELGGRDVDGVPF